MKCKYCGKENSEKSKFCEACGAELTKATKETKKEEKKEIEPVKKEEKVNVEPKVKDGKSTASLVLGICSLVVFCLAFPLSLIGLILGIASKEKGGKRTAGIVINSLCLGLSIISLIICIWFGSLVGSIVSSITGEEFHNIFEEVEKEYEKTANEQEKVKENLKEKAKELEKEKSKEKDTMVIGNEYYGYVTVPSNWHKFIDVNNANVFQYSDIGEYGYIVTLNTYEENLTPYAAATALEKKTIEEGNKATVQATMVSNYTGYVVKAEYKDGTYLNVYLFTASDNKLHFVSIEGPDNTNENFKIPYTFSMNK